MLTRATRLGGHSAPLALSAVVAAIFASTPASAWYDPSDLSTMYQDNFGQTAVTAVEQPVGFIMDKSKGVAPRGAEQVLNGGFDSGLTSWTTPVTAPGTVTITAGRAVLDSGVADGGGIARLRQALTVTPGWYEVVYDIVSFSGSAVNSQLALGSDTSGGSQYLAASVSSVGTQRRVFYASSSTLGIAFFVSATGSRSVSVVDNFSIKPLNGANVWVPTPVVVDANWTDNTGGSYSSNGGTGLLGWSSSNPKLTVGKTYEVTVRVTARTAGILFLPYDGAGGNNGAQASAVGSFRRIFTATVTSLYIYSSAFNGTVDSIQVTELPGIQLVQSTSTARPVLSARTNRFIASEDFTNAAWTKSNSLTVTANSFTAPDGTQTGDELVQVDTVVAQAVYQQFPDTVQAGVPLTVRFRLRSGTVSTAAFTIYNSTDGTHEATTATVIDGPGAITGTTLRSITGLTSTWSTIEMAVAAPIAGKTYRLMVYPNSTSAGVAGNSVGIWGAHMEQAAVLGAYQRVNTSTDYDWLGWPLYLRFDGTDDSLATTAAGSGVNFNLSGTDKVTVFAGVNKGSDVATGMIAELSADLNSNNGTFYMTAPASAGTTSFGFAVKGTIGVGNVPSGFAAPYQAVIANIGDISAPRVTTRINGAQVATSAPGLGTGNFGTYPLYMGARNGSTLRFNGRIYQLMVIGRLLSPDELFLSERYVGQLMGVAL